VIHRDLKPSNLQLTGDGLLKVLDFGVARLERAERPEGETTATETGAGEVLGSPPYMAPEQVLGKGVDARTDVYAAGACLYELATGKRPHGERRGARLTEAILHEAAVAPRAANPVVSAGLEALILKCLDKDPGLRYQSAKELLVDLERLQAPATSGRLGQGAAAPLSRRWLLAAVVGALAVSVVGWMLWPASLPRIVDTRPLTAGSGTLGGTSPSLATDGTRVYYVTQREGRGALMQVAAVGGHPSELPLPAPYGARIHGYVVAESALLLTGFQTTGIPREQSYTMSGHPLWLVPVPSGTARPLADLQAQFAVPSPGGDRVLISSGERLLIASPYGSRVRELLTLPARPNWLA
jgi:hypothetical protein